MCTMVFLTSRRIEMYACWPKKDQGQNLTSGQVHEAKVKFDSIGQKYHFCWKTTKSIMWMCIIPEFQQNMEAKGYSSCCNTAANTQMLICGLKRP